MSVLDQNQSSGFQPVDYAIFALFLVISLGIGMYHACTGGRQRTTKEFLMGNRQMKTLPVALSILVSFVSGILVLGTPAEMYTRGTQLFMRTFGYCVACVLSSVLLVPLFFNLKVTSSFEVLNCLHYTYVGVRHLRGPNLIVETSSVLAFVQPGLPTHPRCY